MAMTGIAILRILRASLQRFKPPKKENCKECNFQTCLAFCMKLSQKQVEITKCPYLDDEAKALLAEESAPPIRKIIIGADEKTIVTIGEETVLSRHEKTFVHAPAFTLLVDDTLEKGPLSQLVQGAIAVEFERVGHQLGVSLIMIRNTSKNQEKFLAAIGVIQKLTDLPLILDCSNQGTMATALEKTAQSVPLIYAATADNWQAMAELSKQHKCPLAVCHSGGLEELTALAEQVISTGVKDIVLNPGIHSLGKTQQLLTQIRRAALAKTANGLGFPVMVFAAPEGTEPMQEALRAGVYVMKYASIIVLQSIENWQALSLFILMQNICTDPQQPLQMEEGVYPIGNPGKDAPVAITTNFSLTDFIVMSEIEESKFPVWLLIANVEGMSVLTAWAADKFNADKIAKVVNTSGIREKTTNRNLILPGAVAVLSGEVATLLPEWQVKVGPREAINISKILKQLAG